MKNKYAILIPVAVCAGAVGRDLLSKTMKWVTEKKKSGESINDEIMMDMTGSDHSDSPDENVVFENNYRTELEATITEDNGDTNFFPNYASLTIADNRIDVESSDGYKTSFSMDEIKEVHIKTSFMELRDEE